MVETKRCPKCGDTKPLEEFGRDSTKRDGLRSTCKPCTRADRLRLRRETPEETRERHLRELQPCGTYAGYIQHKRRGEPACEPCSEANREYKNGWQRDYQQRPGPRQRRLDSNRQRRTGLTPEGYAKLLESQSECCAICGSPDPGGSGAWHIDHDHACCPGKRSCGECVRGALCSGCNMALGLLHDDMARLQSAIDYLVFWSPPAAPRSAAASLAVSSASIINSETAPSDAASVAASPVASDVQFA